MSNKKRDDRIINWITIFYNNGIIKNYTMTKDDARTIFYKLNTDKSVKFGDILAGLCILKYVKNTKKPLLNFDHRELSSVLRNRRAIVDTTPTSIPSKIKNNIPKVKEVLHTCNTCSIGFRSNADLTAHQKTDKQHYYRHLYFTKSTLITKSSSGILIEVSNGSESNQEILSLNTGSRTITMITIRNCTKFSYILNDIVEVNPYIRDVSFDRKNLPIHIQPRAMVELELHVCIPEALTTLFVPIFEFTCEKGNIKLDIFKEIMLHVSSQIYEDLRPIGKYKKSTTVRNDIDTRICVVVDKPAPNYNYVVKLDSYLIPRILGELLAAGLKRFEGMSSAETNYLNQIEKLLQANKHGQYLNRNNYYQFLDLLLHMEEFQLCIDIRNYDTETRNLIKVKGYNDRYELPVPDLAERRPSLLPGDFVYVKTEGSKTYQGVVRIVKQDSVILEFNRKFTKTVYTAGINLSVTYGYNRSVIKCEHRAVDLLSQHRVLAPFFPNKIIMPSIKQYNLKWFNNKIESNQQQQQAILHILSKSSYPSPYLIFGPPGTGKTMTIVEAISQVWKTLPKANILVCAPSNSVANEIALRLTAHVPKSQLFRYMSVSFDMYNIPPEVIPFTNYDHGEFYTPTLAELCDYRIVISTLTNAARLVSIGIPERHFSYVFIDESGHATETETLIAIAGLLTCEQSAGTVLGQIVLAGDPEQLGPIIHSALAKRYGFDISMLERLMTTIDLYKKDPSGKYNPMVLTKLLNNYRSHPSILYLPNKLFYDGELIPKGEDLVNMALNWEKLPNKKVPIIFHSVIGSDQREANSPSYFNIQEIEIVIRYLKDLIGNRLKGRKITEKDIGVIAPYRKQVQKIRKVCDKSNWKEITIGSVEQFQGQERLIIVISTVRSQLKLLKFDNKFHLGFLNNPKRFNVAITRAKALVIVIGNPNLLQHETYWRTFIQYCMDKGCITGTPFALSSKPVDSLALSMAKLRIDGEPDDVVDFSRGNI